MTKWLSARVLLTLGLVSLVTSALMLVFFSGVLPDKATMEREHRLRLSELIAASAMQGLVDGDAEGLADTLAFTVAREKSLKSAALRRTDGSIVVATELHDTLWVPREDGKSTETEVIVPLLTAAGKWGQTELSFDPIREPGVVGYVLDERVHAVALLGAICFLAFYFYLGRMLQHLDPSRAVPDRVRSALDSLAEALLLIDASGRIVLANESFAQLVGHSQDSLLGKQATSFAWLNARNEKIAATDLPWQRACEQRTLQHNEPLSLVNADGDPRSFLANCSPIMGGEDQVNGVLVSLDDVTELQRKEVQLREATERALSANRAKSEFLANMSHEIRTPMNAVLGFTELMRRGNAQSAEQAAKYLDTIHRNGKHLLELINDILDLSKVESGEFALESIASAPHRIAADVIEILAVRAHEKGVDIGLEIDSQIPETIAGDPSRLRQIITNLTGNAIKFTERGAVRIRLRWLGTRRQGVFEIRVQDSGIGIPADKVESIFEPFTQAESSTTRRFGGTGLGLTISRRFARAMGGDIKVESVYGEGSTFVITLPVQTADESGSPLNMIDAHTAHEQARAVELQGTRSWKFDGGRLLVADDSPENRQLVRVVLEDAGIEVVEAENGQEACRLATSEHFDVVLMDMQMPVMDGYTATRTLREKGVRLPIIAFTAHALTGFDKEIREVGCDNYLTKPIDINAMLELLSQYLRGHVVELTAGPAALPMFGGAPANNDERHDISPLHSRLAGVERLRPIIAGFVERLPERMDAIRQAQQRGDLTELAGHAHWLKGSAGSVGFDAFTEPSAKLERAAKGGDANAVGRHLDEVLALAARVRGPDAPANKPNETEAAS
ncbi:MAG: ATP-binding protein [Burkholderiaceae bacterium]